MIGDRIMRSVKLNFVRTLIGTSLLGLLMLTGCDWTTGESGFSTTSDGARINFSGYYAGQLSGGRVVSNTSGGPITSLVINQRGDALEVLDNNGSIYRGRVGGVSVVSGQSATVVAGGPVAHAQVFWSGWDNVAAREIEFVGTIRVVAVQDIVAQSRERESQTVIVDGDTTTTIDEFSDSQFAITEQNSRYRLQGTWIEKPGVSARVDGLAAGNAGVVTTGN